MADAPTQRQRLAKIIKDRLLTEIEIAKARTQVLFAEAELANLKAEQTRLNSAPDDPELTIWCADYTEDLTGEVGTIEIPDERSLSVYPPIIQPGGLPTAAWTQARDGNLQPAIAAQPFNHYYNKALMPAWQLHKPHHRLGTIQSVDKVADTCTVLLDVAFSSEPSNEITKPYDINLGDGSQGPGTLTLENVPIVYQTCNAAVFEVTDRVIVRFNNQDWANPTVIGFESNPKPCDAVGSFMCVATSIIDPESGLYFPYNRQQIEAIAGVWQADSRSEISRVNNYWRNPDGSILGTRGWTTTYCKWYEAGRYRQYSKDPAEPDYPPGGNPKFTDIDARNGFSSPVETYDHPFQSENRAQYIDGPERVIYVDGQLIANISSGFVTSQRILGASVIEEGLNKWLIIVTGDSTGIGGQRPIDTDTIYCYVTAYDPAVLIITPATGFDFDLIGTLDVTGWQRDEATYGYDEWNEDAWYGPFRHHQPFRFTSDGRIGVSLMYNEGGNTAKRVFCNVTGKNGAVSAGGTMTAEFLHTDIPPITQRVIRETKVNTVTDVVQADLSWRGFNFLGRPEWWYIGDANELEEYTYVYTVNDSGEHVIAYDWDENDNLVTLSYEYELILTTNALIKKGRIPVTVLYGDVNAWGWGIITGGTGYTGPVFGPGDSGTAIWEDGSAINQFQDSVSATCTWKRNGEIFYTKTYVQDEQTATETRPNQHDPTVIGEVAEQRNTGDYTLAKSGHGATTGDPIVFPARMDINKNVFSCYEYIDSLWTVPATQSIGDQIINVFYTVPADSMSWQFVTVNMKTGAVIYTADCGSNPFIPPNSTQLYESYSAGTFDLGRQYQRTDIHTPARKSYQIGEEIIEFNTITTPNIGDLFYDQIEYVPPYKQMWVDLFAWGPQGQSVIARPWADVAESQGSYLITAEGIGLNPGISVIVGASSADPISLLDAISLDPAWNNYATILAPVAPLTGVPFQVYEPPGTNLEPAAGGDPLTDGAGNPITN